MDILETHIVPAISENIRLQEYAHLVFKSLPTRTAVKKAIKREEILIDNKIAATGDWIKEGQTIFLLKQRTAFKKSFELKLEVIFEDEFMAVINKPAGIPTSGNYFRTVENALPINLSPSSQIDTLPRPMPVHRLDNPTSGMLIVAKTRGAHTNLSKDLELRKIKKTYLALVEGHFSGTAVYTNLLDEKPAETLVELLEHFEKSGKDFSLVQAYPATGRTHQIRRHLSMNGFPIVGDGDYGNPQANPALKGMYLAATGLRFEHPVMGEPVSLCLDRPLKFRKL
ncbi:RluA family pseudouridine synthase [Antarcticibacterium flavum]|uniref:RluA family pseudouridine synthase n=1 Tax=Antarcticibacterium flavum TaxID=2058175 RepID=A0A5B7X4C3_9FLAO|nr:MULTISPECIES: RluA family pseudouridine synthase [Antarcticibacterium]MCM4159447.1 RNA pseudouridine synthase [Antarcticibacterium sp. W02-3]QCY69915.1 RluA family pseudouridine synthase [Antarcticibacterium flavum]